MSRPRSIYVVFIFFIFNLIFIVIYHITSFGIIQTLRNAVLGENLPLPPPLQRSVMLAICPLPLLRNEIFDPPPPPPPCRLKIRAIIPGIYQKDVLTHNLCDFTDQNRTKKLSLTSL